MRSFKAFASRPTKEHYTSRFSWRSDRPHLVLDSETLPRPSPLLVVCVSRGPIQPCVTHAANRLTRSCFARVLPNTWLDSILIRRALSDRLLIKNGPTETDPWCQKTMLQGMELDLSRVAREAHAIQVRLLPRQYGLGRARFLPGQVSSISGLNTLTRPFTSHLGHTSPTLYIAASLAHARTRVCRPPHRRY